MFDRRHGNDTIVDFVPGANLWIDTGHGSITLIGVSVADLKVDDFLFF